MFMIDGLTRLEVNEFGPDHKYDNGNGEAETDKLAVAFLQILFGTVSVKGEVATMETFETAAVVQVKTPSVKNAVAV